MSVPATQYANAAQALLAEAIAKYKAYAYAKAPKAKADAKEALKAEGEKAQDDIKTIFSSFDSDRF